MSNLFNEDIHKFLKKTDEIKRVGSGICMYQNGFYGVPSGVSTEKKVETIKDYMRSIYEGIIDHLKEKKVDGLNLRCLFGFNTKDQEEGKIIFMVIICMFDDSNHDVYKKTLKTMKMDERLFVVPICGRMNV